MRILSCLGDSDLQPLVYRTSLELARATGASLTVLRVISGAGEQPDSNETLRETAVADLQALVQADTSDMPIDARVVVHEGVWEAICATAMGEAADLIVIGAHPHGVVERVLGTTAPSVVVHSRCSVLVVRPGVVALDLPSR